MPIRIYLRSCKWYLTQSEIKWFITYFRGRKRRFIMNDLENMKIIFSHQRYIKHAKNRNAPLLLIWEIYFCCIQSSDSFIRFWFHMGSAVRIKNIFTKHIVICSHWKHLVLVYTWNVIVNSLLFAWSVALISFVPLFSLFMFSYTCCFMFSSVLEWFDCLLLFITQSLKWLQHTPATQIKIQNIQKNNKTEKIFGWNSLDMQPLFSAL